MKVIGFEEHYQLPAIFDAHHNDAGAWALGPLERAGYVMTGAGGESTSGITDLGDAHIAAMDAAGIDVQILSHTVPGPQTLAPGPAVELARHANDAVAAAVTKHPDRFRGFATLPMRDPAAAAEELGRVVTAFA